MVSLISSVSSRPAAALERLFSQEDAHQGFEFRPIRGAEAAEVGNILVEHRALFQAERAVREAPRVVDS